MSDSNTTSTDTELDNWIVVVPIEERSITKDISIVDAASDPFNELTGLQQALAEANETANKSSIKIDERESRRFVDATEGVDRVPNDPGIIIRYHGELYRVYIMGLT
ncbi:hypothetical protein [Natronorubrum halophilum]|uniref:hypothetical protein n=1 Tax=Natronorubrum halophilum TaxID=1702106 RepID=UPI0013CEEC4C|nr:hypothetical protein [Natronorubrum halophilum]